MCKRLTQEIFIERAKQIHNNKYDYSLVEYNGSTNKIKIICPIHGIFEQSANSHLQGTNCFKCANKKRGLYNKLTKEEFINKANRVHNNKYDYSLVNYKNSITKVKIICPVHSIFEQQPNNHLVGKGCSKCRINISKGEKEVLEYIKSVYSGKIIENTRQIITPYELDIFLPELNLAIEYNGEYWHKIQEKRIPGYHNLKEKLCQEKGITLINVWENEWKNNLNLIKMNILNKITLC